MTEPRAQEAGEIDGFHACRLVQTVKARKVQGCLEFIETAQ
jgi:hypothetical protein